MGFFSKLKFCQRCHKSGFSVEIGSDGYCDNCRAIVAEESARRAAEARRSIAEESQRRAAEAAERRRKEEEQKATERRYRLINQAIISGSQRRSQAPKFKDGCVLTYYYHRIRGVTIDRNAIEQMALDEDYSVTLADHNGEIVGMKYGVPVIRIEEKQEMCRDWIRRGDPIFCEIVNLMRGSERLMLGFYRDEETRLAGESYTVCKLTSCRSEEKQINIACLEDGERLYLEDDGSGRFCVTAFPFYDIGVLPAKYTKYDKSDFDSVFYDHGEDNGNDVIIPFVRVYMK